MRRIAPNVFIKFVDACESGVSYIKNSIDLEKFQKTKSGFKDVFFLFSSSAAEASYADSHLSYLTESVINAIIDHKADRIKYANILNYTSDFFENLDFQRPYVVQQGNINNVFCSSDEAAKIRLSQFLRARQPVVEGDKQPERKSRLDLIKEASTIYCSKEETELAIERCSSFFRTLTLDGDLSSIYSIHYEEITVDALPPTNEIGTYLTKSSGKNYFAKAVSRDIENDAYSKAINNLALTGLVSAASRKRISGFEHTTKISVPGYRISAASKYAAVNEIRCFIAPIISQTNVLLAHRIYQYELSDWDRIKMTSAADWRFEGNYPGL